MELSELERRICNAFIGEQKELNAVLEVAENDKAIFPFNRYEYLAHHLIHKGYLTHQQYFDIRSDYIKENPYLYTFEISGPRTFGEKFAQEYVQGLSAKLEKPSKTLDVSYDGEYDLWLDGIKIEVKASRVVDRDSEEPLYLKALSRETTKRFVMNFQQLKPQYCDVFIWLAAFRDQIVLWVLGSQDVLENPLYSEGQHRGNSGNEGQLHVNESNIQLFSQYELVNNNLETMIREASKRSARLP